MEKLKRLLDKGKGRQETKRPETALFGTSVPLDGPSTKDVQETFNRSRELPAIPKKAKREAVYMGPEGSNRASPGATQDARQQPGADTGKRAQQTRQNLPPAKPEPRMPIPATPNNKALPLLPLNIKKKSKDTGGPSA